MFKALSALALFTSLSLGLTSHAAANSSEYVEGPMKYRILENGKKDLSFTWNEEDQILTIRLGLVWASYDPAFHADGFDLGKNQGTEVSYPLASSDCTFYKAYGSVPGVADFEHNEVYLEFKGSRCKEDLPENFKTPNVAVYFFSVRPWNPSGHIVPIFCVELLDTSI